MRKLAMGCLTIALVLGTSSISRAQDEPKAILEKAIKAHGGAEKLNRLKAVQAKSKGNIQLFGGLDFTQEMTTSFDGKFKEVMNLEANGQKINVVTLYNGQKGALTLNGKEQELPEKVLEELKEASYAIKAARLVPLLSDPMYTLSALGEVKVNDKPAVGVKVSSKGHRDISLYFDKDTGLLAKTESRKLDGQTMQEVDEERIVTEYQDVDGQKAAKKLVVNHDGKKFMELEVSDIKFLDKVDDSEFQKP
ncbi:MAG TPA: hypothetical protein VG099_03475 [Gemmataceae bacterium]|nr:hypothetical protein [Gemmataceae bacterium]